MRGEVVCDAVEVATGLIGVDAAGPPGGVGERGGAADCSRERVGERGGTGLSTVSPLVAASGAGPDADGEFTSLLANAALSLESRTAKAAGEPVGEVAGAEAVAADAFCSDGAVTVRLRPLVLPGDPRELGVRKMPAKPPGMRRFGAKSSGLASFGAGRWSFLRRIPYPRGP